MIDGPPVFKEVVGGGASLFGHDLPHPIPIYPLKKEGDERSGCMARAQIRKDDVTFPHLHPHPHLIPDQDAAASPG